MVSLKYIFRIVAFLEGISYIILLFIATPIKYMLGDPTYVKLFGMPHGVLFVLYVIFAFILKKSYSWNFKVFGIVLIASLIPFGTFYVDKKYLKAI